MKAQGLDVSPRTVAGILKKLKYSLQANRKVSEGQQHPACQRVRLAQPIAQRQ